MKPEKGIPFVDLVTPHLELEEKLIDELRSGIRSASFIGGPAVEEFERQFADFCDTEHCVGVGSGTDALRFALIAAGVGRDDVVITVPNTFVATVEAIAQAGATPKFVDVDARTLNLSVEALQEYLDTQCSRSDKTGFTVDNTTGENVRAIIPVHLYGQMCDMDAITEIANTYDLLIIEDACQAHGSQYFSARDDAWKRAGSIGKAAGFSFYPGKNLGACGEAGAVTTNDADVAAAVRMIRDHGQGAKYYHEIEGYNGRLDSLQARILSVKMAHIREWNDQRRAAAEVYADLFSESDHVRTPQEPAWSRGVYHLYVVSGPDREGLQKFLEAAGVGTGRHYPVPVHLQAAYRHLGYREGDFPVAEKSAREILSLPMFPHIQREQQMRVVEVVDEFFKTRSVAAI